MKKAVLIIAFIFILLSISQASAVLVYNSAKSNVSNKISGGVSDDVDSLLKEVKKAEPREDAKKGLNAVNVKLARAIQTNVSDIVVLLRGSWDDGVPCGWEKEVSGCVDVSSQREATLGTFQKGNN